MKIFSPEIIHTFCLSEKAIREIANPFYTDKRDGWSDTPRGTRHRCYEKRHPLRLACAPPKSLFSVKIKNKPASSDSPRPTLKGKYRSVFLDIRESENKMKPTGRQSSLSKKKKSKRNEHVNHQSRWLVLSVRGLQWKASTKQGPTD